MVTIISAEDLQTKTLKELKAHVKALQAAGYPIDYDSVRNEAKSEDDVEKFYRKKIRHAQRSAPAKKSPGKKGRAEELDKLTLRSKNNEPDLLTIAKELGIQKRTKLTKQSLIAEILKKEKVQGPVEIAKAIPAKDSSPKNSSPKNSSKKDITKMTKKELLEAMMKLQNKSPESTDEEVEEVEEEVKVSSKSKSKSPKPKSTVVDEDDDEVEEVKVVSVKSKSKSKSPVVEAKKSKSKSKECGEFSREELLNKRLKELRQLLQSKGIDASDVDNTEHAADIFCQFSKNEENCGEDNDFACSGDKMCDISVKPGVCVDKGVAAGEPAMLEYNGRQIVGSKEAIKALRKKLGISKSKEPDPFSPEGFERSKLLKRLEKVTGESGKNYKSMSNKQLADFIDGYAIKEKKSSSRVGKEIVERDVTDLSVAELGQRAELLKSKAKKSNKREDMVEVLASWLDRHPSEFKDWTNNELEDRIDALADWESLSKKSRMIKQISEMTGQPESEYEGWSEKELKQRMDAMSDEKTARGKLLRKITKLTGQPESFYEEWSDKALRQRLDAMSGDYIDIISNSKKSSSSKKSPAEKKSSSSKKSSPEKVAKKPKKPEPESEPDSEPASEDENVSRQKQEDISYGDVEKVLSDVMAGKQGKIEELSQVQNAVLRCLGLVSA